MVQEQDHQPKINWAQVCTSAAQRINSINSIDANLVNTYQDSINTIGSIDVRTYALLVPANL